MFKDEVEIVGGLYDFCILGVDLMYVFGKEVVVGNKTSLLDIFLIEHKYANVHLILAFGSKQAKLILHQNGVLKNIVLDLLAPDSVLHGYI